LPSQGLQRLALRLALFQLAIFIAVMASNIEWQWPQNGYLACHSRVVTPARSRARHKEVAGALRTG
jgi:hypothetical protein